MNPYAIIDKYYPLDNELKHILVTHSRSVADKALAMARKHPELQLDIPFIEEAAMLHDIGIFKTDADKIYCMGHYPYICHGYLGADLMREEGFPKHALVCERHTGAGLTLQSIISQGFRYRTGNLCRSAWKSNSSVLPTNSSPKPIWTVKRVWKRHGKASRSTEKRVWTASITGADSFCSPKNTLKSRAFMFI